jgi:hypothetical protein
MTNFQNRYKFTVEFWILENDDLEALRAAINYLEAGQVMEFRTAGYSFNFMEQMNYGAFMPERVINMRPLLEVIEGEERNEN